MTVQQPLTVEDAIFDRWAEENEVAFLRSQDSDSEAEMEATALNAAEFEENLRIRRIDTFRERVGWLKCLINEHRRLVDKYREYDPDPCATAEMYREVTLLHADLKDQLADLEAS